jgi:hypothetical protein
MKFSYYSGEIFRKIESNKPKGIVKKKIIISVILSNKSILLQDTIMEDI